MQVIGTSERSSTRGYSPWTVQNDIEYARDGVTAIRGIISPLHANALLAEAKALLDNPGPFSREHELAGSRGRFHVNILMHLRSALFLELATLPAISNIAKSAIASEKVYFFYDQLFYKAPSTQSRTQWHQDLPFWPLKGHSIPSIWIALTCAEPRSSSVQYVVGSHLWGCSYDPVDPLERDTASALDLNVCPNFHEEPFKGRVQIKAHVLAPGDVVIHHPLVVHGAGPNEDSANERAAISLRYCGPEVEWDDRPNTMFFPTAHNHLKIGTKMLSQSVFMQL
jgi:ectoine hydroxylase-related dioxygenase (phytanoyl-CoA dioxygenase family)